MSKVNDLLSTILGGGGDAQNNPEDTVGSEGNNPDRDPYYYNGSLPRQNSGMGRRESEQKAKSLVFDKFLKKMADKKAENSKTDEEKSEGETSGVATGSNEDSTSTSDKSETLSPETDEKDNNKENNMKEEKKLDIDNGYESTRPLNLKRESRTSINLENKAGKEILWDLARGISQDSNDTAAPNKMQALFRGKYLFLYVTDFLTM